MVSTRMLCTSLPPLPFCTEFLLLSFELVRHDDFHSLLYVHLQSIARPTYLWFSLENEKRVKFVSFFLPLQNAQKDRHNYKVAANFSSCRLFCIQAVLTSFRWKTSKIWKLKNCKKIRQIECRQTFTDFLRFFLQYLELANQNLLCHTVDLNLDLIAQRSSNLLHIFYELPF